MPFALFWLNMNVIQIVQSVMVENVSKVSLEGSKFLTDSFVR